LVRFRRTAFIFSTKFRNPEKIYKS
jgi:hypothetical protein